MSNATLPRRVSLVRHNTQTITDYAFMKREPVKAQDVATTRSLAARLYPNVWEWTETGADGSSLRFLRFDNARGVTCHLYVIEYFHNIPCRDCQGFRAQSWASAPVTTSEHGVIPLCGEHTRQRERANPSDVLDIGAPFHVGPFDDFGARAAQIVTV